MVLHEVFAEKYVKVKSCRRRLAYPEFDETSGKKIQVCQCFFIAIQDDGVESELLLECCQPRPFHYLKKKQEENIQIEEET